MTAPAVAFVRLMQVITPDLAKLNRAARIISSYLDQKWNAPRKHEQIGVASFLLIDPQRPDGDLPEIEALRQALHSHLFGTNGEGAIRFLSFSGNPEQAHALANLPDAVIARSLEDGSLAKAFPGVSVADLSARPAAAKPRPEPAAPPYVPLDRSGLKFRFSGIYNAAKHVIAGSAISCRAISARGLALTHQELSRLLHKGEDYYDLVNLEYALSIAASLPPRGVLVLPISYGTLTRDRSRAAFTARLARFEPGALRRLCLSIYDAPMQPNLGLLGTGLDALEHCGTRYADLQIINAETDLRGPFFERLFSVTLMLEGRDVAADIRMVGTWVRRSDEFRAAGTMQCIGNVLTRPVLAHSLQTQAPLLSGGAVTGLMNEPLEIVEVAPTALPIMPRLAATG